MVRRLLKSGAELQHLVSLFAGCRLNRKKARAADGQCASFVEQNSVCVRQCLERCAAFDQNAAPRCLGNAGDECDWRRENEGTRRRRDKHGETANQIARNQPCGGGDDNSYREEDHRKTVRQADEWCFRSLGRRDQADDAGICAGTGDRRGNQFKCFSGIERATKRRRTPRLGFWQRFPGECRTRRLWPTPN